MFTTIVVGTDGSDNAEEAVRVAAGMARAAPGTKIHLVAAFNPWAAAQLRSIATEVPADVRPHLEVDAVVGARLERAMAMFDGIDPQPSVHAVIEDPTDTLLDVAEEHGADLIVVGSRGEGAFRRAVHGSVATKVVQHAPCAVMVVKPA